MDNYFDLSAVKMESQADQDKLVIQCKEILAKATQQGGESSPTPTLGSQEIVIQVSRLFNVERWIRAGFIPAGCVKDGPTKHHLTTLIERTLIKGWTSGQRAFWRHTSEIGETDSWHVTLQSSRVLETGSWILRTREHTIELAQKSANSLELLLFYPEEVYPSYRPRTNMTLFRSPSAKVVDRKQIEVSDKEWKICGEDILLCR